jgi:hypothetical protein
MPDEIRLQPSGATTPRHQKRHSHSPTDGSGNVLDRPTIADFTNAQHDHADADDGGAVVLGSGSTIVVKDANFTIQDDADTTKQAKFQASGITTATTRTYTLPDQTTTLVGIDVVQTLTGKTIVIRDGNFTLVDDGDTTKAAKFEASGITTGTVRTFTLPNADTTVVGTDVAQTLTNKTLTAPTIADFTNAAHDHGDADDGGRVVVGALPVLPSARAYHDANQSIATGGGGAFLAFNQERWDTDTIHDTVTNNTRLTCKTAGYYSITAGGAWETNGTGSRSIGILLNGATPLAYDNRLAPADINARFTVTTVYPLAVNDYVEVAVFQSSGGALNVLTGSNYSPEFSMHWVGPTS